MMPSFITAIFSIKYFGIYLPWLSFFVVIELLCKLLKLETTENGFGICS